MPFDHYAKEWPVVAAIVWIATRNWDAVAACGNLTFENAQIYLADARARKEVREPGDLMVAWKMLQHRLAEQRISLEALTVDGPIRIPDSTDPKAALRYRFVTDRTDQAVLSLAGSRQASTRFMAHQATAPREHVLQLWPPFDNDDGEGWFTDEVFVLPTEIPRTLQSSKPEPRKSLQRAIIEALTDLWPPNGDVPNGVSAKKRNDEILSWLIKTGRVSR
ncbi:MAG: hypothetical protein J0H41_09610, partial [Rhizobiales bacterium]|nr:hypothetical protein [Hyphomicrobiales bacterium]